MNYNLCFIQANAQYVSQMVYIIKLDYQSFIFQTNMIRLFKH